MTKMQLVQSFQKHSSFGEFYHFKRIFWASFHCLQTTFWFWLYFFLIWLKEMDSFSEYIQDFKIASANEPNQKEKRKYI
jgi:hypothetical protein